jgi:hypothetical protein
MAGTSRQSAWFLALFAMFAAAPAWASVSIDEEEVVFRLRASGAGRVYLVGDFNGWNPTLDLMVRRDTLHEIRLYLVPGSYRYRFIVDGVSVPDPDNPCRDAGDNSCFVLVEARGALAVVLTSEAPDEPRERASVFPAATLRFGADRNQGTCAADARLRGTIDERAEIDCSAGLEARGGGDPFSGSSFLLRGTASYRLGERTFTFFARTEAPLEETYTIPLFGRIGPYRYAPGLMSRGAAFMGRILPGIDARIVYASRIAGYRSALDEHAAPADSSARREMLDGDALAIRLVTRTGPAIFHALHRLDKRRIRGEWRGPNARESSHVGYERGGRWGGGVELQGDAGCSIDGSFVVGGTDRIASAYREADSVTFHPAEMEKEWEHGYRISVGAARKGEHASARAWCERTVIEELSTVAPQHTRDVIGAECSFERGSLKVLLAATIERYGASGAGSRFWLSGKNFWIDGDEVTCGRLPFFSSREIRESCISFSWKREPFIGLPWGTGTTFNLKQSAASGGNAPRAVEARLRNGTHIHPRLAVILDMRGVSYRYGAASREYVDTFLGLHGRLVPSVWFLIGCGVNPYSFDHWTFDYDGWGRERYLEKRGVLDVLAARGEQAAVERLLSAEEALADDWLVTVNAGFAF